MMGRMDFSEEPQRAIDDPVKLARAAKIMRRALERQRDNAGDERVRKLVDDAPPLTAEQIERLRGLLSPNEP